MRSSIPISEALGDPNLLGAALGDIASWQNVARDPEGRLCRADERRRARAVCAGGR